MFRRFLTFALAALLSLLAACGGGGSGEPFQPPAIRTSGQLTADKGYVYLEVFGRQDAQPWKVSTSLRAGATFIPMNFKNAKICVREYGSTRPCGSTGTVTFLISNSVGGDFVFDVSSLPSVQLLGWGESLVLEIVIEYAPFFWRSGDSFSVAVTGITYNYDGGTQSVSYIGYPGSSVTLARGTPTHHHTESARSDEQKKMHPQLGGALAFLKRMIDILSKAIYFILFEYFEHLFFVSQNMRTFSHLLGCTFLMFLVGCSQTSNTSTVSSEKVSSQVAQTGGKMSFFITSTNPGSGGNLGGLSGADAYCQTLATNVGAGDRKWHAYLSATASGDTPGVNARDRIGKGPWYNAKGVLVAENLEALHGVNNISKATALTEKGFTVFGRGDEPNNHDMLTGSMPDGTASGSSSDTTCGNWTKDTAGSAIVGHHDRIGINDSEPMKSWTTSHGTRGCSLDEFRSTGGAGLFYCFAE